MIHSLLLLSLSSGSDDESPVFVVHAREEQDRRPYRSTRNGEVTVDLINSTSPFYLRLFSRVDEALEPIRRNLSAFAQLLPFRRITQVLFRLPSPRPQ